MKWELALKRVAAKAGLSVQRLPTSAWEGDAEFPRLLEEATKLTMVDPNRLFVLYQLARRAQALKGDAAEVGVYRGGTARLLGRVFHGDRTLHLFDTFAGMARQHGAAEHFLNTVNQREDALLVLLFGADLVASETRLQLILGQAP